MEIRPVEIVLYEAKDLNKVNLINKMNVCAVVSISGGGENFNQKTKTPVDHCGDANPFWNFTMKFTVDESALQQNRLTLDFKLLCERALGDKDIGEVHVSMKSLFDSSSKNCKRFVSYQVRKPSGKPKGQLTFLYKFGEKTVAAPTAPPYTAAPPGKADMEPVMAYPARHSSVYPPPGAYPMVGEVGGGHYPPPPQGYGYQTPSPGYGYPPPPGYGYPVHPGYGYNHNIGSINSGWAYVHSVDY